MNLLKEESQINKLKVNECKTTFTLLSLQLFVTLHPTQSPQKNQGFLFEDK